MGQATSPCARLPQDRLHHHAVRHVLNKGSTGTSSGSTSSSTLPVPKGRLSCLAQCGPAATARHQKSHSPQCTSRSCAPQTRSRGALIGSTRGSSMHVPHQGAKELPRRWPAAPSAPCAASVCLPCIYQMARALAHIHQARAERQHAGLQHARPQEYTRPAPSSLASIPDSLQDMLLRAPRSTAGAR